MLSRNALLRTVRGARSLSTRASQILSALDIPSTHDTIPGVYDGKDWVGSGEIHESICPATNEVLARIRTATPQELQTSIERSREAYKVLRSIPGPVRGELVRQIRNALAAKRDELGGLITLEMGKIKSEGIGEVQEFLDICDYGVGLSRMMNGRVIASERPGHSILEVPNPLGVLAVLSAFNFPVAVYGWNLAISLAAGNATVWKPSPTTPLCAIAVTRIISQVLEQNGIPGGAATLVTGGKSIGTGLVESKDVDLVSFTGSTEVGRAVGQVAQSHFKKTILELGGNNASIVMSDADLSLAIPAVFFGAVGTAGQRCTSTRRLYLQRNIATEFLDRLQAAYKSIKPGDPLVDGTLLGPMHSRSGVDTYTKGIAHLKEIGAEILTGGSRYTEGAFAAGNYVKPTIAIPKSTDTASQVWKTETFAPILNVAIFDELEEAIQWNNSVPQGLSSSLWTRDMRNVGKWIGPAGSDAGIVNVNVGTSGAEIGAAFGGNKHTGWGRESGGDAWKQYVRWSACTVNYSDAAPLAQGVNFSI